MKAPNLERPDVSVPCPHWDGCNAPLCPLDKTAGSHLSGEPVCRLARELVKVGGREHVEAKVGTEVAAVVLAALPDIRTRWPAIARKLDAAARTPIKRPPWAKSPALADSDRSPTGQPPHPLYTATPPSQVSVERVTPQHEQRDALAHAVRVLRLSRPMDPVELLEDLMQEQSGGTV